MLLRGWAYSVLRLLCRPRVAALLVPYSTCRKQHTQTCDRECRAARAAPGIALRRVEQRYAYKSKIPAYIAREHHVSSCSCFLKTIFIQLSGGNREAQEREAEATRCPTRRARPARPRAERRVA